MSAGPAKMKSRSTSDRERCVGDALDRVGGTGAEAIVAAISLLPNVGRGSSENHRYGYTEPAAE